MIDTEQGLSGINAGAGSGSASDPSAATESPSQGQPQLVSQSWGVWLRDDVRVRYTDLPLMACCFVSGLCDSVTVNASNVFVSMQTGNTVFLALGAAGLPAQDTHRWLRSLVSILAFAFGCFCFSNTRRFHPTSKSTLAVSFFIQGAAIFVAAALAQATVVPDYAQASVPGFGSKTPATSTGSLIVLIPVALLAWQFGGQISSSRMLGFGEVPTCVLTSVYCDLLSDPKLLAPLKDNPKRNRRFMAIVLLLLGGVCGGWLQRSAGGMVAVLWIAGFIKLILAVSWTMWPSKVPDLKG